jgi:hypothetical protein
MRTLGNVLRGWGAACLVALGCTTTQPSLKPPPQPEKLDVPPDTEARFSSPMEYPKGTPKSAQIKRASAAAMMNDPTKFQTGASNTGMYGS